MRKTFDYGNIRNYQSALNLVEIFDLTIMELQAHLINPLCTLLSTEWMHATPKFSLSHPETKGRSDPKFTNRRESGSEFYTLSFSKASLAYGTLFRMCNNTVISQPCIENSLIISLADNTNEIASLTAILMSPFLSCWFVVLFYTSLD